MSGLYVTLDNDYISEEEFKDAYDLSGETRRLVCGLIKYLKTKH